MTSGTHLLSTVSSGLQRILGTAGLSVFFLFFLALPLCAWTIHVPRLGTPQFVDRELSRSDSIPAKSKEKLLRFRISMSFLVSLEADKT